MTTKTKNRLQPHDLAKWRQAALNKELAEGSVRALLAEFFGSYNLDKNAHYVIDWNGDIIKKEPVNGASGT